jgi:TetR/AcrR family transcriptional repressor of nem operon
MSRTKEFDIDHALERAVEVFWENGYEATSMRELETRMGIGRQSLYDTFGDKKELFLKALERYRGNARQTLKATILEPDASLPELRTYFEGMVTRLTGKGSRNGCMVASAILEIGDSDAEISDQCRGNERAIKRAFTEVLSRAASRGEIRADLDPGQAATYLVGQMYGLTVLARNGATRASLLKMVDHIFTTI